MEIVNLTPHEVKVLDDDDNVIATFPSVGVARARQHDVPAGEIESIPVVKTESAKSQDCPSLPGVLFSS